MLDSGIQFRVWPTVSEPHAGTSYRSDGEHESSRVDGYVAWHRPPVDGRATGDRRRGRRKLGRQLQHVADALRIGAVHDASYAGNVTLSKYVPAAAITRCAFVAAVLSVFDFVLGLSDVR